MDDGDSKCVQLLAGADAGEQHQPRAVHRAAAQDQLTVHPNVGRLALEGVLQAHGAAILYDDLPSLRVRLDRQVWPMANRLEVRGGGTVAARVLLCDVVPTHPFLTGAVEVRVVGNTELLGGAYEGFAQRIMLHL